MTVTSAVSRDAFTGNGSVATYTTTWLAKDATEVIVYEEHATTGEDALLTVGVDYSAVLNANGTISVTRTAGNLASPIKWVLERGIPYTQTVDLTQSAQYNAATMQRTVDRLAMEIGRLQGEVARCLKIPHLEAGGDAVTKIDTPAAGRANLALGFDSSGNVLAGAAIGNVDASAFMLTLLDDTTADAARTTLGIPSQAMTARTVVANDTAGAANGTATLIDNITVLGDGTSARRDLSARAADLVDIKDFGAVCDGATDDYAAWTLLTTYAGSNRVTVRVGGVSVIGTNYTVPSTVTVQFINRGALSPTTGRTVTYNGRIIAEPMPIFQGAGTVSLGSCLTRTTYAEWWGAVGDDATDNYTALNNCFSQTASMQGVVQLGSGAYRFGTNLALPYQLMIRGVGKRFGTTLKPVNCSLRLHGAGLSGGYIYGVCIRDLCVDGSATNQTAISIDTGYNLRFENVFVYNFGGAIGINIVTCNDFTLDQVTVYGVSSAPGFYGIKCGNATYGRIIGGDVEVVNRGIWCTGTAQVDIIGVYAERNVYGLYFDRTGEGSCTVSGGVISLPNAGSVGIGMISGTENVTLLNVNMVLNGGAGVDCAGIVTRLKNCRAVGFKAGDIVDANNVLEKIGNTNIVGNYRDTLYNKKTYADNVAGNTFTVNLVSGQFVMAELVAYCTGAGTGYAKKVIRRQFLCTCPAGTAEVSTIQPVGTDVDQTSSGNWNITLTTTAPPGGAAVVIAINADSSGALGAGTSTDVFTRLEIESSSLSNYVTKN